MATVQVDQYVVGAPFTDTLKDDGNPVNLTGATDVRFVMYDEHGTLLVNAYGVIVNASLGQVAYTSVAGDLDEAGNHRQHWDVDYPDPLVERYPTNGYNVVQVLSAKAQSATVPGAPGAWISWDDVPCDIDLSVLPGDENAWKTRILAAATNALYDRTCRQFGFTEMVARPVPCCVHRRPVCGCGNYLSIDLGHNPVLEVSRVIIDGLTIDPASYRVDEWRWLVRLDGDMWPRCNNLDNSGAGNTFSVEWTYGLAVPPEGIIAAGLLACKYAREFAEACGALPANTSTVSRDGVTVVVNPPKPGESFGVTFVDDWVSQFHCSGRIFDPARKPELWRVGT